MPFKDRHSVMPERVAAPPALWTDSEADFTGRWDKA